MSDSEKLIPLSHAARFVPNRAGGFGINVSTIWRWKQRGIKGVRLRTQLVGGIVMTKRAWLEEFYAATTAAAGGTATAPKRRDQAIEAAERELDAAGI